MCLLPDCLAPDCLRALTRNVTYALISFTKLKMPRGRSKKVEQTIEATGFPKPVAVYESVNIGRSSATDSSYFIIIFIPNTISYHNIIVIALQSRDELTHKRHHSLSMQHSVTHARIPSYCTLTIPLGSISYIANCPISDGLMNRPFRIVGGVYNV